MLTQICLLTQAQYQSIYLAQVGVDLEASRWEEAQQPLLPRLPPALPLSAFLELQPPQVISHPLIKVTLLWALL